MEYPVSREVVQSLCNELTDLVPYLTRIIESLERHCGLYSARLAEVVPVDVIEELDQWLKGHLGNMRLERGTRVAQGLDVELELLERIFPGPAMPNVAGSMVREARYRAGRKVTQRQLAVRLQTLGIDISRTAISRIEVGRRPVTDSEVAAICKALDVSVQWLLGDTG